MAKILIYKKNNIETEIEATVHALKKYNAQKLFKGTEKVLINPNWIVAEHHSKGNTTSTNTLEGIVKFLIEICKIVPQNIIVGEGGYPSETNEAMKINEISRLEENYGIIVKNINNDPRIAIKLESPLALKSCKVAKTSMEVDVIISVPSLKTHSMASTTLAMKNLMGILLPKGIMHSNLHKKIADLTKIFRDKMRLSIIDGFVGSDGMEEGGSPVKMDIIIVGEDPVALDTVGSKIIGYTSKDARYLEYGEQLGLGTCNFDEIEVMGSKIKDVEKKFY
jgi:uncharacterized protein (DUF362 family)